MKTLKKNLFLFIITILIFSCQKESKGRFNFPLIKSKIELNNNQEKIFDKITKEYTSKARQAWIDNNGDVNRAAAKSAQKIIFEEQDVKIKKILNNNQYKIYITEVNIERKGREKHNMELIKSALNLDSIQTIKYDLANQSFFTTLIKNQNNFHGKPTVYEKYHKEIDVNRRATFKDIFSKKQFNTYLELVEKYHIGKFEH